MDKKIQTNTNIPLENKPKGENNQIKSEIRGRILDLGADCCGFASAEDFSDAPEGFRPVDLYPECRSVVVYGKALPAGLMKINPRIMYSHFNGMSCELVDELSYRAAGMLEKEFGAIAVPVPCDGPYDSWDQDNLHGHGLLSMKHLAVKAGLGSLGKNTMLLTQKYGNRLTIGCVLTNLELDSDEPSATQCTENCLLCVEACPEHAIEDGTVNQKKCRLYSCGQTARGFGTVDCNRCRSVCPKSLGSSIS